jgi:hypothetical protein
MTFMRRLTELIFEAQIRAWMMFERARGMLVANAELTRTRYAAQTLVEWSIVAAVMALIGITAWQAAGTAITDAINRTVGNLGRAGG